MVKGIRNSLLTTAILYVALGVVLMLFPDKALKLGCGLIGLVTLGYGVVRIVSYMRGGSAQSQRFQLFAGVALGVVGVFLLVCPQFLVSLIPMALGVYILVDSIADIKQALDLKALGFTRWWVSLLAALLLGGFGIVMILQPFSLVSHLVMFIGVGFVLDGVSTLANTIAADRASNPKQ